MASFSRRQWFAIGVAVILFTLLFFINRKPPKVTGDQPQGGHTGVVVNIDSMVGQSEAVVPMAVKNRIERWKKAIPASANEIRVILLDSVISLYDSLGAQLPSGYYAEKLAAIDNSTDTWFRAGDSYYKCAEIANNSSRLPLLQRAMQCFDNALKADPKNLQAKVGKAECIVEGAGSPMEGIGMIEDVLKQDSNNEKALVALGTFSIQSGQYAKAIARFTKVLKIDPTFIDAYLYMAQASEGEGNKAAAVGYLKKYSTFARDSAVKVQVNNYIKKLEGDTTASVNKEK